jgi:transposase
VARAQDFRGLEFSAPLYFENTNSSFNCFIEWIKKLMDQNKMEKVIVGMELTGYYWFNLTHYLKRKNIKFVVVNPMHVKDTLREAQKMSLSFFYGSATTFVKLFVKKCA